MAKKLKITYGDKTYTLEYNRASIRDMEANGFDLSALGQKPITMLPMLFAGAFKMHHRFLTQGVIDDIYENTPNKEQLLIKLAEMYNEPVLSLMSEPEKSEGNANWETDW